MTLQMDVRTGVLQYPHFFLEKCGDNYHISGHVGIG